MVDNQHQKISGYRDLTQDEIDSMNMIKTLEIDLGTVWKSVYDAHRSQIDPRWMSIAKTHFEEGISAFVRAVARPEERF